MLSSTLHYAFVLLFMLLSLSLNLSYMRDLTGYEPVF
jgi:hypothetical protein